MFTGAIGGIARSHLPRRRQQKRRLHRQARTACPLVGLANVLASYERSKLVRVEERLRSDRLPVEQRRRGSLRVLVREGPFGLDHPLLITAFANAELVVEVVSPARRPRSMRSVFVNPPLCSGGW
jgi:hypothetical protein